MPSIPQKERYSVADTIPIGGAIYWALDTVLNNIYYPSSYALMQS